MPDTLYFEDFHDGRVFDLGAKTVTKEEIVEFAQEFDPQPFHLDEEAGKASMLGGLAASGWHTCSMVMRLLADGLLNHTAGQGSPGITQLKWRAPVLPGDVLTARAEVLETRRLRSRPTLGLVNFRITATNQAGKDVLVQENPILFLRREAAE